MRAATKAEPAGGTRRVAILGLPVDGVSMDDCVEVARAAIDEGGCCRIVVTNANKSFLAHRDARLRTILAQAELVVPEWATVWAGRLLGREGLHHVGGITLMARLLEEAERRGWSCFFLGARPEVVSALATRLASERPALRIAGMHHGYMDDGARREVLSRLPAVRPDLLFVAMGSPRQEYLMSELPEGAARVVLGVGGSFDVLAGLKKDAPGWARGHGLEWLYRLAQDPRRLWRRYLVTNSWFVAKVLGEGLRTRRVADGTGGGRRG